MKLSTALIGGVTGIIIAALLGASKAEAMMLMILHVILLDRLLGKKDAP